MPARDSLRQEAPFPSPLMVVTEPIPWNVMYRHMIFRNDLGYFTRKLSDAFAFPFLFCVSRFFCRCPPAPLPRCWMTEHMRTRSGDDAPGRGRVMAFMPPGLAWRLVCVKPGDRRKNGFGYDDVAVFLWPCLLENNM